jgi:hypothetical protein
VTSSGPFTAEGLRWAWENIHPVDAPIDIARFFERGEWGDDHGPTPEGFQGAASRLNQLLTMIETQDTGDTAE